MPEHLDENGFVRDEPDPRADAFAIAHCEFCDDDGIRGVQRCDHQDWAAIAERGMAKVRAELDKIRQRKGKR